MKKLIGILTITSLMFASSATDEINKKLDLLLQKIDQLEKKVDQKDQEINQLKKEIQKQQQEMKKQEQKTKRQLAINSCTRLKVSDFNYKYYPDVIPYFVLSYKIHNDYPAEIKFIRGSLIVEDKDKVTLLQDYVSREVDLKPKQSVLITKKHILTSEFEKNLNGENPKNLRVYFQPTRIEFKNGQVLECY